MSTSEHGTTVRTTVKQITQPAEFKHSIAASLKLWKANSMREREWANKRIPPKCSTMARAGQNSIQVSYMGDRNPVSFVIIANFQCLLWLEVGIRMKSLSHVTNLVLWCRCRCLNCYVKCFLVLLLYGTFLMNFPGPIPLARTLLAKWRTLFWNPSTPSSSSPRSCTVYLHLTETGSHLCRLFSLRTQPKPTRGRCWSSKSLSSKP